jgi:hypothetical protein
MAWIKGIILKLFPYTSEGKKDADADTHKEWTIPEELFFFPYAEVVPGAPGIVRTVGFPKDNLEATIALEDVGNPKQVHVYRRVKTMWVERRSKVVEVPAPVVVVEPKKRGRK